MEGKPSLSVIIPTYRRAEALRRCLRALLAADAPPGSLEVIVVDDGGKLSRDIEAEFPDQPIRWVYLPRNGGQAAAQQAGFERARGQILAFLDDDCIVERNWPGEILDFLKTHADVHCVVGRIEALDARRILSRTRQEIYNARYRQYADEDFRAALKQRWNLSTDDAVLLSDHLSGGNCALRRDALQAVGGFDARLRVGSDAALSQKLLQAGYVMAYNPAMLVRHEHDPRLRTLYRIGRRKMAQRFAMQPMRLRDSLPLLASVFTAPLAIRTHPEMWRADHSRLKVYLAYTAAQLLYALGELTSFVQAYPRAAQARKPRQRRA
jgi:GT2 family glycosyltransferase